MTLKLIDPDTLIAWKKNYFIKGPDWNLLATGTSLFTGQANLSRSFQKHIATAGVRLARA